MIGLFLKVVYRPGMHILNQSSLHPLSLLLNQEIIAISAAILRIKIVHHSRMARLPVIFTIFVFNALMF